MYELQSTQKQQQSQGHTTQSDSVDSNLMLFARHNDEITAVAYPVSNSTTRRSHHLTVRRPPFLFANSNIKSPDLKTTH